MRGVQGEQCEIKLARNAVINRRAPPNKMHHFLDYVSQTEREQQFRDNRRDEVFNAAGWRYFKFNADDLANDFRRAVRKVVLALHG